MNISSAIFDRSAPDLDSCPDESLPEFAFIGRSNVGKSSLLNMLAGEDGFGPRLAHAGVHQAHQHLHDEQNVAVGGSAGIRLRPGGAEGQRPVQQSRGRLPGASHEPLPGLCADRLRAGAAGNRSRVRGMARCATPCRSSSSSPRPTRYRPPRCRRTSRPLRIAFRHGSKSCRRCSPVPQRPGRAGMNCWK